MYDVAFDCVFLALTVAAWIAGFAFGKRVMAQDLQRWKRCWPIAAAVFAGGVFLFLAIKSKPWANSLVFALFPIMALSHGYLSRVNPRTLD